MSSIVVTNLKLNPSRTRSDRPGWPSLLALTVAVSAAHLWLMTAAPLSLGLDASRPLNATAPLNTRTITAQPPSPAATPRAPAAAAPQPVPPSSPGLSITPAGEAKTEMAQAEPPVAHPAEPTPSPDAANEPAPTASAAASAPTPMPAVAAETPPRSEGAGSASPPDAAPAAAPTAAPAPPASDRQLALAIPGSARLNYQVTGRARGFDYSASAQLDWQHDGQRYQARLVISSFPLPSRSQSSVGEIGPDGLSPRRFSDRLRGEVAVHFQPELSRITFSANGTPAIWQPGAQDRLSLSLQLAAMIAGDAAHFTPGTKVTVLTAGTRSAEPWEFTVMGTESLSLPIGTQNALRLRREPRHQYDQTVEIWFAPALGHLPARILLSQGNGDLVDQRLASIERP